MRFSIKLILAGIIAVSAIILWQGHRSATGQALASGQISSAPAEPNPVEIQLPPAQKELNHARALIHWKLAQWREARARDSQEDQDRLMQEMLALLTDENVAEIISSLSADELNTPFGVQAIQHWAQVDPVATANWLAARPGTTEEQTLAVADYWAANRGGLQQFIDQFPDSAWKQNLLADLGSEISATDPGAAIKLTQQMKPGDAQTNLLQSVACRWMESDPDAAYHWIMSVDDPSLHEKLIVSAAQSYALTDPAQAAGWLVLAAGSDEAKQDAALNILKTWTLKDPAGAAGWVDQFPDGNMKARAVSVVSSHWQQSDSAAAALWTQKLAGAQ